MNDLRYALRVIRKFPLSNAIIVLTIAFLVAVVGSWYGSLRAADLQKMPFDDSARMVRLWRTGKSATTDQYPYDLFLAIKERSSTFEKLGALTTFNNYTLTEAGEPVHLRAVHCNAEVLEITGKQPVIGRFFSPTDETPENRGVVVLSEQVWRRIFQGRGDILGQDVMLNEVAHTVIGVAPSELAATHLAHTADLWLPRSWEVRGESSPYVDAVGVIKEDFSLTQAQAELDVIVPPLERERPLTEYEERRFKDRFAGAKAAPLNQYLHRSGKVRNDELYAIIFGIVMLGCVILIACFNMTSLFLVQATSRAREMAVRLSIGAGRWRIVRQMLIESLILSTVGGVLGGFIALALIRVGNRQLHAFTFDPGLFLTALGVAAVIGAGVSLVPALRAGRTDLTLALKDGGQSSASRHRHRLRNFLVGAQIAMSTLLTITGVLFAQGFQRTASAPLRIDPARLVTVEINLDRKRYREPEQVSAYAEKARVALAEMPGVEHAVVSFPGVGQNWNIHRNVNFVDPSRRQPDLRAGTVQTSPGYFSSLGLNILRGRPFSAGNEALDEVIVNREWVKTFSPADNPLGLQFRLGGHGQQVFTVIGVVEDMHLQLEIGEIHPKVYLSHLHPVYSAQRLGVLVTTKADATAFGVAVRATLQRLDSLQALGPAVPLSDVIERNVRPVRIATMVIMGMAVFGLLMSLMGVYGVVSYAVVERTREMGIRMALGATGARIVRTVMMEGTRLVIRGGVPAAIITCLAVRVLPLAELRGVNVDDPLVYLVAVVSIALTSTLAALLPARRMLNLKPGEALRYE